MREERWRSHRAQHMPIAPNVGEYWSGGGWCCLCLWWRQWAAAYTGHQALGFFRLEGKTANLKRMERATWRGGGERGQRGGGGEAGRGRRMKQDGPLSLIRPSLMDHISSITPPSLAADWSPAATMSAPPHAADWASGSVTSMEREAWVAFKSWLAIICNCVGQVCKIWTNLVPISGIAFDFFGLHLSQCVHSL